MKKFIFISLLIPILSFSQNTKTDKVLNQVNSVSEVAGNVIGLFKKKKDKTNTTESQNTASNKTSSENPNAKAIDFYELLTKIIPDTGKPANINTLDKSSKFVKWRTLNQLVKGYYDFSGEGKISYDGIFLCEDFFSFINLDVYSSGIYKGIGLEILISDHK